VQTADGLVVHDFEEMGMAGNEKFGWMGVHGSTDGGVVFARIAADVLDEHIDPFAGETVFFRETVAQVATVDIAIYGTERGYGREFVGDLHSSNVAGVPNLITLRKIFPEFCIPIAVGIG
jgi:hypothetical protein